jgi:CBS-domain-containing membrane protein
MSPCPVTLHGDKPAAEAANLLHRTHLEALAVVDAQGQYQGAVIAEDLCDPPSTKDLDSATAGQLAAAHVPAFDPDTHLERLLEFFARKGGTVAAIVHAGKPIGFVSAASLAELTRPPERLPAGDPSLDSDYLLVPECFATAAPD